MQKRGTLQFEVYKVGLCPGPFCKCSSQGMSLRRGAQRFEAACVRVQIRTGTSGSLYFGLPVTSILNSVVTLTVDAGSLTLVQNVAPGKVVSAQVSLLPSLTLPCRSQHEPYQQQTPRESRRLLQQKFLEKVPQICSTYCIHKAIHTTLHCRGTLPAANFYSRVLLADDASL